MEEYRRTQSTIKWTESRLKNGSLITYENTIMHHGNHLSISKNMYVDREMKHSDLCHIPIEIIEDIKKLKSQELPH